jgi:hypothetical protein
MPSAQHSETPVCRTPGKPRDSELSSANGSLKALLIYLITWEATVMPEFRDQSSL